MNSVSINVYINWLDDIVHQCINTYYSTVNNFDKKDTKEESMFKGGASVRISKYKSILQNATFLIGPKKICNYKS